MTTFADMSETELDGIKNQLNHLVRSWTGLKEINLTLEVGRNRRGDETLKIDSNDIAGLMNLRLFKRLSIINFGGNWSEDKGGNPVYWLPLNYSYEHFSGGHNGTEIGVVFISEYGEVYDYQNKLDD
jgi:hypothetical protein